MAATTTTRKNRSTKEQALPARFRVGFLRALDGRTDVAKALRASYDRIVADIGGASEIGHVKSALIERFVYLEAMLQSMEQEIAQGKVPMADLIGRWTQATNALAGLAKTLGIERKGADAPWLDGTPDPSPKKKEDG